MASDELPDPPGPVPGAWIRIVASGGKPEDDWRRGLARMYRLWAELGGRDVERIDLVASTGPACLLRIDGPDAWSRLRFEDGIHRVERVLSIPGREMLDWVHARVDVWPAIEEVATLGTRIDLSRYTFGWAEKESLRVFGGLLWKGGPIAPFAPSPSDGPFVRTYSLHPTPRVFDERCEWATRDVQHVLDGGLDELLAALASARTG